MRGSAPVITRGARPERAAGRAATGRAASGSRTVARERGASAPAPGLSSRAARRRRAVALFEQGDVDEVLRPPGGALVGDQAAMAPVRRRAFARLGSTKMSRSAVRRGRPCAATAWAPTITKRTRCAFSNLKNSIQSSCSFTVDIQPPGVQCQRRRDPLRRRAFSPLPCFVDTLVPEMADAGEPLHPDSMLAPGASVHVRFRSSSSPRWRSARR